MRLQSTVTAVAESIESVVASEPLVAHLSTSVDKRPRVVRLFKRTELATPNRRFRCSTATVVDEPWPEVNYRSNAKNSMEADVSAETRCSALRRSDDSSDALIITVDIFVRILIPHLR